MADYDVSIHIVQGGAEFDMDFARSGATPLECTQAVENVLLDPLKKCLDQLCTIRSIKATNINGGRDFHNEKMNVPGTQTSDETSFADVVRTTAKFKLYGVGAVRGMDLRGITDSAVKRSATGAFTPSARFRTQFGLLLDAIAQAGLCIKVRKKTSVSGYEWKPIKTFAAEADTDNQFTRITMFNAHTLVAGDDILVSVPKEELLLLPYKGIFTNPIIPTTTTFTVAAQYKGTGGTLVNKRARLRKLGYDLIPITRGVFDKFGSRDTKDVGGVHGAESGVSYR